MARKTIFYKSTRKIVCSTRLNLNMISVLIRQFLHLYRCVCGINAHYRRKISLVHLCTSTPLLSGQASEAKTSQNSIHSTKKLPDFCLMFIKINNQSPIHRHKTKNNPLVSVTRLEKQTEIRGRNWKESSETGRTARGICSSGSGYGPMVVSICEHSNGSPLFTKSGDFYWKSQQIILSASLRGFCPPQVVLTYLLHGAESFLRS